MIFLFNSKVPPPLDWTEFVHVTGYWFLENADANATKKWDAPPDLLQFIDRAKASGKKL